MVRRTRRNMRGDGFFGDLFSGVKKAVGSIGNAIKGTKLLSTGLSLIPHPAAQTASRVAGMAGLGRKRKSVAKPKPKAHPSKRKPRAHKSKSQVGGAKAAGIIALPGVRSSARPGLRL